MPIAASVHIAWNVGDAQDLRSTEVYLSRTGPNGTFERLATQEPNQGAYDWTVTGPLSSNVFFKIVARDSSANVGVAISDAPSTIVESLAADGKVPRLPLRPTIRSVTPNPSAGRIAVTFTLPAPQDVRLTVHDLQGRCVANLFHGACGRGEAASELKFSRVVHMICDEGETSSSLSNALDCHNRCILGRAFQRQDFNGRVITIRHDDLKALACILDLGPEQVAAKLDDLGLRYVNRPA